MKKRNVLLILLAVLLILGGTVWYMRPVPVVDPELEPERMQISLICTGGPWSMESRSLELDRGDPQFDELLAQMKALRFRRPPTNLILQAIPALGDLADNTKVLTQPDYQIYVTLGTEASSGTRFCYNLGDWMDLNHRAALPLLPVDLDGRAWAEALWELAE